MKYRCPVCNKIVQETIQKYPKQIMYFPFCSKRCKYVDLGAWLDSEYKLASKLQSQDSDDLSGASYDDTSEGQ